MANLGVVRGKALMQMQFLPPVISCRICGLNQKNAVEERLKMKVPVALRNNIKAIRKLLPTNRASKIIKKRKRFEKPLGTRYAQRKRRTTGPAKPRVKRGTQKLFARNRTRTGRKV